MPKSVKLNAFQNYIGMIHRSVDSELYRHLYATVDGVETDILQDGKLSCAYFVSSVLFHFKQVEDLHATVTGLEADLNRSGWQKTEQLWMGSIIIWEPKVMPDGRIRRHTGFYVGNGRAVSNSTDKRVPHIHDVTFGKGEGYWPIESIYLHKNMSVS